MFSVTALFVALAAGSVLAAVSELAPIPADLSTPVQQRLAFHGPTGMVLYSGRLNPAPD